MQRSVEFNEKLSTLPFSPGVYLMKNSKDKIIYVGKSKCLKNRVSSYFHSSNLSIKTAELVSNIFDFEIIVTRSEKEALVLENELIKRHNPKYNIKLKDGKTYPYILLENDNGFPRLSLSRRRKKIGKYFGPYTSAVAANDIIKTVKKTFKIPDCNKKLSYGKSYGRPCLNFHLGYCNAPCSGKILPSEFDETFRETEAFLKGDYKEVAKEIEKKMYAFSDEMNFEEAAKCRDKLNNLKKLSERQSVVSTPKNEEDVFGFCETETLSCITVLKVRGGIISDKESIFLSPDEISDAEALADLILRYYGNYDTIPRSILISFEMPEDQLTELQSTLCELSGHTVNIHRPERGSKHDLCKIADSNSAEAIVTRKAILSNNEKILFSLCELLMLEVVPERIESYDISNSGTTSMYAGMIVLDNGKFSKNMYRSFSIKSIEGQDDYGAMREALARRLAHIGKEDDESMTQLPDLILLDGGVGHVNAIKDLLFDMNIEVPVFGMVKDDHHKTRTLTDGENEISIALNQEIFNFIYRVQEEVHRYTFSKMDASRRKSVRGSSLCEIKGIGEAKAKELLAHFGSLNAIKSASIDELTNVRGISSEVAQKIYTHFNSK